MAPTEFPGHMVDQTKSSPVLETITEDKLTVKTHQRRGYSVNVY
ncbi:MAG: hypothetical protein UU77_C0003G0017 [candidate division WWE3 bacterium GW2011_GWC1_41_7]|uniref:Uncharacterized protein n=3 Tax=Katanobacteria TaxID=422282 RepID=A0A0G0X8M0_UNCKA|nr:MAG: hypothetical protein UU72_C0050G0003 [candidate division WWE3 bacterium GW2011_GWB1_41_6]KKS21237.1 MAG: hypothetical protein UU80_C0032G0001 [candidate division WWE3 bacterium GW2011_GWA1_41_8]KKS21389.1 MAG: hypothetical protein UU77_C0003G0017 [candidate division WWE3 bacterium GW2011_GWC1_41_7]